MAFIAPVRELAAALSEASGTGDPTSTADGEVIMDKRRARRVTGVWLFGGPVI